MARTKQTPLSAARLDEFIAAGSPYYRRVDDGSVERHCSACDTWQPADTDHFYVVTATRGQQHAPRYRTPCRSCDTGVARRRRLAAKARAQKQSAEPVVTPAPSAAPVHAAAPAPIHIRASALPELLTGLRECRQCARDLALDATCFRPTASGFASVCIDCTADIAHRVAARRAPLILPIAAGATRSDR